MPSVLYVFSFVAMDFSKSCSCWDDLIRGSDPHKLLSGSLAKQNQISRVSGKIDSEVFHNKQPKNY